MYVMRVGCMDGWIGWIGLDWIGLHACMHAWMDGWMDGGIGWRDGGMGWDGMEWDWMDGWMDG